jgi:glutamate racemase
MRSELLQRQSQRLAPIGVFDSGAGGFTVLSALLQEAPHEHYIYFGDTAHIPYGNRPPAEIIELTANSMRFLLDQHVKLIVIACNTASQAALHAMRDRFPEVPFIGVVPAVKPAARLTQSKKIAVLATNQAVKAEYLQGLIASFAVGVEVITRGCPELVTLVEAGKLTGPEAERVLEPILTQILASGADTLVLGCTHFPALRATIERLIGPEIQVIDSGAAIARRMRTILTEEDLLRPPAELAPDQDSLQVWCSGDPIPFSSVASKILGYPVVAQQHYL